jgi:hypothetical protein
MWRTAAALERLAPALKEPLGDALARLLARPSPATHILWSLGRLGARVPLFAPANAVVHTEHASAWLQALLAFTPQSKRETNDIIFALGQLARKSGDRARDIAPALQEEVLARLQHLEAEDEVILAIREYHELARAQQSAALGDALPVGLRIVTAAEPAAASD